MSANEGALSKKSRRLPHFAAKAHALAKLSRPFVVTRRCTFGDTFLLVDSGYQLRNMIYLVWLWLPLSLLDRPARGHPSKLPLLLRIFFASVFPIHDRFHSLQDFNAPEALKAFLSFHIDQVKVLLHMVQYSTASAFRDWIDRIRLPPQRIWNHLVQDTLVDAAQLV